MPPITLDKLTELLNTAIAKANKAKGKSPVLFVGNTGSGKSTTINLLYGCLMKSVADGSNYRLEVIDNVVAEIGHTKISKTLYPQIIDLESEKLVLADCPGYGENRKQPEVRTCAARGVQEVIKASDSIRGVVVVIDYPSLSAARAETFVRLVNTVSELLKPIDQLSNDEKKAITFIITKVPLHLTYNQVITDIKNIERDLIEDNKDQTEVDEEDQRQLAMLSLVTQSKIFMVRQDGKGCISDSNEALSLEANRQNILTYLSNLPINSISKESFVLLDNKSKLAVELSQQTARINLHTLATLSDNELCPISSDSEQNSQAQWREMQEEIRALAAAYLKSLSGEISNFSNEKLLAIHESLTKYFTLPLPSISIKTFEHLVKTLKYLQDLKSAINILFRSEEMSLTLSMVVKNILHLRTILHQQLSKEIVKECENDHVSLLAALTHVQKTVVDSETALTNLNNQKNQIIVNNTATKTQLEQDLATKNTTETTLEAQGRPALAADQGAAPHVPEQPGPQPANPGPEPHVRSKPQDPAAIAIAGGLLGDIVLGPFNFVPSVLSIHLYKIALKEYNQEVSNHSNWQNLWNAYQNWIHTNNVYTQAVAAHAAWQAKKTAYDTSVNNRNTYDTNLTAAKAASVAAQAALDSHNTIAAQNLAAQQTKIDDELVKERSIKTLRLLLIGAEQALTKLLESPNRSNAIANYQLIVDKLNLYQKDLPPGLLQQLQTTLDSMRKEDTAIHALYENTIEIANQENSLVLAVDKSIDEQLTLVKPNLELFALNHGRSLTEIARLCQLLRVCGQMLVLDLKESDINKQGIAKLLPLLMSLPKLYSLNLSQNQLDDESGLVLLTIIYAHPTLIDINLDTNPMSPVMMNLIKGMLTLKQSLQEKNPEQIKTVLDAYLKACLASQELLSLSSDKTETRQFDVEISSDEKFTATYNPSSGALQFDKYWKELQIYYTKLKLNTSTSSPISLLFKLSEIQRPSSEEKPSLATTAFFTVASKNTTQFFGRKRSDSWSETTHWYTHDEMQQLLHHAFDQNDTVTLFDAIDAEQFSGATLMNNLYDRLVQSTIEKSLGIPQAQHMVLPVNLGNRHWVALYINLENETSPMVTYVDSFGNGMPQQIRDAITKVFPNINEDNIVVTPFRLQEDGYNCGPWVVECLKYLVIKGGLPPEGFSISDARTAHQALLISLAAEPSASLKN